MKAERRARVVLALVALAGGLGTAIGAQQDDVAEVSRLAGTWYEVASYGAWWQRGCARDATLSIVPRGRTEATLQSRCRGATGRVTIRNGRLVAPPRADHWRARFAPAFFSWLPAVWGDFWVIGHDEALRWFVVGERDHVRLSVFSRDLALDEGALAQAIGMARRAGFDVARLARAVHDPDEWRSRP